MTADLDLPAKPQSRSDIAREKILNAALEMIAECGLPSVSHRMIARRAGVQLSLTSYYFGTLENLLTACHDHLTARTRSHLDNLSANLGALLAAAGPPETRPAEESRRVAAEAADLIADYICEGVARLRVELAAECNYLYAWSLPPELRLKVQRQDRELHDLAERLVSRFSTKAPEIDGALIVMLIRDAEFRHFSTGCAPDRERLRRTLYRLMLGFLPDLPA